MKRSFLSLVFILFIFKALPSFSQTEKGNMLLGGSGNMLFEGNYYFEASLEPNIGLFMIGNFALGATLPLSYQRHTGARDFSQQQIGFTPFVRYYFGAGSTRLFTLASYGYSHYWRQYQNDFREHTLSSGHRSGSAGIGLAHFLTEQIGLEARVTYNRPSSAFSDSGRIHVGIGFQIHLPSSR